ncbi:E3 ubiquitin-protein ligase upl6 [Thalictrum thalictroides]|uniref:HECT-type E3 ubiquitin transferase n=1 Tax=Thalictrum thalictroides TaxID=46969 RepID=A0A7J6V9Z5_THATH|nr:E3 ubiquitin-protein ligase upl6 [Thalictrum thalictroides]
MFFSGDSSRKRVALGGKSSKETDARKLIEQAKLERKRRDELRIQNSKALKIQKCFRGRKVVQAERSKMREQFYINFGNRCQKVDRQASILNVIFLIPAVIDITVVGGFFTPIKKKKEDLTVYMFDENQVLKRCFDTESEFLPRLLFLFDARNIGDVSVLVETCRILHQSVRDSGDVVSLFASTNYFAQRAIVDNRIKRLAYACLQAVHQNRNQLKDQLLASPEMGDMPTVVLLEAVVIFTNLKHPWACKTVSYFSQKHAHSLLRDIVRTGMESAKNQDASRTVSSLEQVLINIVHHKVSCGPDGDGKEPETQQSESITRQIAPCDAQNKETSPSVCPNTDPYWSFSPQILSLPFLWRYFPSLKKVFSSETLIEHYIHQMAVCLHGDANVLPADISSEYPGYACLLGNMLEVAGSAFSRPNCSFDMAIDFAAASVYMLEVLPPIKSLHRGSRGNSTLNEDDMEIDEEHIVEHSTMNADLEQQISNAIDPHLLQHMVSVLFKGISLLNGLHGGGSQDKVVSAVGAMCAFLHITFNTFPVERIMTGLAYRTELVPMLWKFMKHCHENQRWPSLSDLSANLPRDAPGWLLPLAVFCPVYKHMLMIVDNEEFYEKEKPLALKDIKSLIIILRHALWQLLWMVPAKSFNLIKSTTNLSGGKRLSVDFIQHRVSVVTSELLTQLEDWNNRRQFTAASDFHALEAVDESFMSQAVIENTRAYDILRQAPFLVPFTSRVKIFTSQLRDARQRDGFARNRISIRRNRIFEDAFNKLGELSGADLRGLVRVAFLHK